MTRKAVVKVTVDISMTVLLLFVFDYRIAREASHEWAGMALFTLVLIHNILNRKWWRGIFSGVYHLRRIVNTAVNILISITMFVLAISGILGSKSIFSFANFLGSISFRQVHTTAAYLLLVLVAVHIGMHWNMIVQKIKLPAFVSRIGAALVMLCGIYASFERDMLSKLFLGFSFNYWDKSAFLFYAAHLAIMGLYIGGTYYAVKIILKVVKPK